MSSDESDTGENGADGAQSESTPRPPYDDQSMAEAITGAVEPEMRITDIDQTSVAREASFADVANRPKKTAIENARAINDVVFYRRLSRLDGDLAGTIRAKTQVASMGPEVSHPAVRGRDQELDDLEREIMESCADLLDTLGIKPEMQSIYEQLVIHGNDVMHVEYEDGIGVTDVQELPLQALTIVDDRTRRNGFGTAYDASPALTGGTDMERTISDADYYVLNENNSDTRQVFPETDIIHMAIKRRGNWYTDRLGRDTFGVWGERRLEPVKFALQAKQNTLANKVALDDSMLAREIYHIDVETLFGHIPDDQERTEKARKYKEKLKEQLNNLDPDEKPILPQEVDVTVEGPDGSTADNQSSFIEMMNNTIQHALTFHSASFGRDAGGSLAGNNPAKEMSDTGVKSLRDIVKREFRELFKIHALLAFPDARQPRTDAEGNRVDAEGYRQWELQDDITLPILVFDPVSRRDKSDRVKDAVAAYEKGVADLNEARSWVDLEPVEEDEVDDMLFRRDPRVMDTPDSDMGDGEGGVGREQNESEEDQGQGPGQGQDAGEYGHESREHEEFDADEYVYDDEDEGEDDEDAGR